jgi:hypothetical protein
VCEHNSGKRLYSLFGNEVASIAVVEGEVFSCGRGPCTGEAAQAVYRWKRNVKTRTFSA